MGTKGSGKPKWTPGREMPLFSGKSWSELEDIFPADMKIASDAYKIISVIMPAWIATQAYMKSTIGGSIPMRDFFILCWLQRCEDAKEDVAFESWPAMKGMNIGGKLWYLRKSNMTALGLIENIPVQRIRIYRITALGKMVIRNFTQNVEQAHHNLRGWVADKPEDIALNVTKYLKKFFELNDIPQIKNETP